MKFEDFSPFLGRSSLALDNHQLQSPGFIGVAGFVHPGDYVDVITTMRPQRGGGSAGAPERVAKIILQNIRVLSVGEHLETSGHKPVKVQVVTLESLCQAFPRLGATLIQIIHYRNFAALL